MKFISNLFLVLFAAAAMSGCSKGGTSSPAPSQFQGIWKEEHALASKRAFSVLSISDSGKASFVSSQTIGLSKIVESEFGTIQPDGKFTHKDGRLTLVFKKPSADRLVVEPQGDDSFAYVRVPSDEFAKMKEDYFKTKIPADDMTRKLIGTQWELVSKTDIVKESSRTTAAKDIPEFTEVTTSDGKKMRFPFAKKIVFVDDKKVLVNGSLEGEFYFHDFGFSILGPDRVMEPSLVNLEHKVDRLEMRRKSVLGDKHIEIWLYKRLN